MFRSPLMIAWATGSAVWIAGWLTYVILAWSSAMGPIHEQYRKREMTCKARYADAAARDRCLIIMDLERFQSRSIAIANRALLVLGPPALAWGGIVYLRRRTSKRKPTAKGRK